MISLAAAIVSSRTSGGIGQRCTIACRTVARSALDGVPSGLGRCLLGFGDSLDAGLPHPRCGLQGGAFAVLSLALGVATPSTPYAVGGSGQAPSIPGCAGQSSGEVSTKTPAESEDPAGATTAQRWGGTGDRSVPHNIFVRIILFLGGFLGLGAAVVPRTSDRDGPSGGWGQGCEFLMGARDRGVSVSQGAVVACPGSCGGATRSAVSCLCVLALGGASSAVAAVMSVSVRDGAGGVYVNVCTLADGVGARVKVRRGPLGSFREQFALSMHPLCEASGKSLGLGEFGPELLHFRFETGGDSAG